MVRLYQDEALQKKGIQKQGEGEEIGYNATEAWKPATYI